MKKLTLCILIISLCGCSINEAADITAVSTAVSTATDVSSYEAAVSVSEAAAPQLTADNDPNPGLSTTKFLMYKDEKYYSSPEVCFYMHSDSEGYMMLIEGNPDKGFVISDENLVSFEELNILFNESEPIGKIKYVTAEATADFESNLSNWDGADIYLVDKVQFHYEMYIFPAQPVCTIDGIDIYQVTFAQR